MEDQVENFLTSINLTFPKIQIEIVHNLFSPTLKHLILKDQKAKGFGGDHNLFLAVRKAYSELIERKVFLDLNKIFSIFKTSNGFAAHPNQSLALENSILEVIERDAFMLMWHGKVSPFWLNSDDFLKFLSDENIEIVKHHQKYNLKLHLGIISTSNNIYTAIACVKGFNSNNFFYIDCKTGNDLKNILNSLVESITFHSHYIVKGYVKELKTSPSVLTTPMDHFNYYLFPRKNLDWFFKGQSNVFNFFPEPIASYNCDASSLLGFKNLQCEVYFSESSQMQNYYCGKLTKEKYNKERYTKIFGKNFLPNKQVHPLS